MVKVNWSPDNEKKLVLHLINPTTSNIDTVALAKRFPGAKPKAIHERIQKLRRERVALLTTGSASESAFDDGNTGKVAEEAGDTPKKKRGRLSKKEAEAGVGGAKKGYRGGKRKVEAMERDPEDEMRIKLEYENSTGVGGGDGDASVGEREPRHEMDEDGSNSVGRLHS